MSEDNTYLLLAHLVLGITLCIWVLKSRKSFKTLILHGGFTALYGGFFFYQLKCNSAGGSGLLWLVFWLTSLALHWLLILVAWVLALLNKKRRT